MKIRLLLFFLSLPFLSICQNDLQLIKQIEKTADFITTDRLGNLYAVKDNHIWMYNKDGDSLRAFNSQRFGKVTHLDCSDPYQLLAFFQDYNLVLFLDNFLSQNGEVIDLQTMGLDQVTLASHSREGGFWVFDQMRQKVFHLNDNLDITHESVNFMQWFGKRLEPTYLIEYNNQLYLNEPQSGLYVFDHFGTYSKQISIPNLHEPQILEGRINFERNGQICQYSMQNFETTCQDIITNNNIKQARIEKGRLYTLSHKKIRIYKTK